MGLSFFDETQPWSIGLDISPGTGTGLSTLISAPTQKLRIDAILCRNTDTVDRVIDVRIQIGGTNYIMGSVLVPFAPVTSAVAPTDLIAALVPAATGGLVVSPAMTVNITVPVALAANHMYVVALGGYI